MKTNLALRQIPITWILFAAPLLLCTCKQKNAEKKEVPYPLTGKIERLHPALDSILGPDAGIEILADSFAWSEGPLWIPGDNYLLFTDIPPNRVMRWSEGKDVELYLSPSGYTGASERGGEPGANGLLLDPAGRLVLCQHGDRRVARMDASLARPAANFVTLAGTWDNKRLNSPNDAVFDRKGNLYFTDPPYGLEKQTEDPAKEIPFQGVYRCRPDGTVDLLVDSLTRPNGIAFSPDEKTLYIANSDPAKAVWMAYDVADDGRLKNGRVFFDATSKAGKTMPGLPDGLKVDRKGTIFATGPGGVWIFDAHGTVLGRIDTGQPTSNCAFGNNGRALYITANMFLMRVWLK